MRPVLFFFVVLAGIVRAYAQEEVRVYAEARELRTDELLRIVIAVDNGTVQSHDEFPELKGFEKVKTEKTSQQRVKSGKIIETELLVQYYKPQKEGLYMLNAFNIKVNDKVVRFSSVSVRVKKAEEQDTESEDETVSPTEETSEFRGLPAKDAFLILRKNKSEIYVGEGFTLTFAFCVLKTSSREIQFYDFERQFNEIMQKIRPTGCLAYELFSAAADDLVSESIVIQGKEYYLFRLYKAAIFPLGSGTVKIPGLSVTFSSKKTTEEGEEKGLVNFSAPGFSVLVKETPAHPYKNKVASGVLRLKESVSTDSLRTGESFTYKAEIVGEGNFGIILPPKTETDTLFDFFLPVVLENKGSDGLRGSKSFTYTIVTKSPGDHRLGKYFQWIYFNTKEKRYDTLASNITVSVRGERKNVDAGRQRFEGFYKRIETESNELVSRKKNNYMKHVINVFVMLSLVAVAAALIIKRKKA